MKLLEILKRMLSCATTETSEPTEVSKSTVLPLVDSNKESKDYADLDDIRLVVGDKTLALVYNVCMGGLHNVLHYDPCSHDTQDCFSEINAIIEKNLEEAYESIVVKTGENQYLLNIGVNLLLGPGSLSQQLCDDVINVFYPIIKRFIDEHVVNNKVGVYSVFTGGNGTSVGLLGLVNLLEKDGYICCGVGTSYDSHSYPLKRAKGWHGFTYIALEELIKGTEKLPKIKILSLLHDRLIEKMQQANRQNDDKSRENTEETNLFLKKWNKDVDSVYKPFSGEYWYLWYKGQCQTFADVIAALNNKYHYSNTTELIHDFNAVINEYTERGTVDVDAVAVFENILSNDIFVKKLFNKGSLNLNIFRGLTLHQFIAKSGASFEEIYRYRASSKIFILTKTLNDICHYTDAQLFKEDFLGVISGRLFHSSNHVMDDPIYPGNCPICGFVSGLGYQWNNMVVDGILSNELMYKVMFEEHERKLMKYGIDHVLEKDFEAQGPCHPEVFYPKARGTAPVYVKDETSRKYLIACGEGKGPCSGHELYEMELVKPILEREVKQGKYIFVKRSVQDETFINHGAYIPLGTIDKPVFVEHFGRLHFASKNAKKEFIEQYLKMQ